MKWNDGKSFQIYLSGLKDLNDQKLFFPSNNSVIKDIIASNSKEMVHMDNLKQFNFVKIMYTFHKIYYKTMCQTSQTNSQYS